MTICRSDITHENICEYSFSDIGHFLWKISPTILSDDRIPHCELHDPWQVRCFHEMPMQQSHYHGSSMPLDSPHTYSKEELSHRRPKKVVVNVDITLRQDTSAGSVAPITRQIAISAGTGA